MVRIRIHILQQKISWKREKDANQKFVVGSLSAKWWCIFLYMVFFSHPECPSVSGCVCIHPCVCVYTSVCVCVYTSVCVCVYISVCVCIHQYGCVYTSLCVCACLSLSTCVCVCVWPRTIHSLSLSLSHSMQCVCFSWMCSECSRETESDEGVCREGVSMHHSYCVCA